MNWANRRLYIAIFLTILVGLAISAGVARANAISTARITFRGPVIPPDGTVFVFESGAAKIEYRCTVRKALCIFTLNPPLPLDGGGILYELGYRDLADGVYWKNVVIGSPTVLKPRRRLVGPQQ